MTKASSPNSSEGPKSAGSADLPRYNAAQFVGPPLECDAIMKGGVTSGIVYPYAILEIATRYRFRSLGGTSAGAIAAAFAAAAEYARAGGDHKGFERLQSCCDELPNILLSLFQPDREFAPIVRIAKRLAAGGKSALTFYLVMRVLAVALIGAIVGWLVTQSSSAIDWEAVAIGGLSGVIIGLVAVPYLTLYRPVAKGKDRLVGSGFGACSGLSVGGAKGLTDWLHDALQHIAFGDLPNPEVLTFGHLERPPNGASSISLKMVTTNLSMGRPHTLPELGIQAGFEPQEWGTLFPAPVLDYLKSKSGPWHRIKGARRLPVGDDLPVICAVRMSLSFPLLFKAIPILSFDHEFKSVVKALGGAAPAPRLCKLWLSDGGLSSNFPIHLFDAPLPSRPTFAISLDSLQVSSDKVKRRVLLPHTAAQGSGVQVTQINSLVDFGWQVLASAKDWQDQLASEISGQRERIARIFLDSNEGGLNLDMPADVSTALMSYGLAAGQLFTNQFNFDEHRWRRTLGVYRNTGDWLDRTAERWSGGYDRWFASYAPHVKSYKEFTASDRKLMASQFTQLARASAARTAIKRPADKFPANTGQLRVTGRY